MARYLDMIDSPEDVKKLHPDQLPALAQEVREELINVLSKTGGHLGPNLGVTELSIALHRVFSTPKDKFVWDVSHQVYVHKLFTGRRAIFPKVRSTGGPMGFAFRAESPHDCYGAGHAGTALSAALGMCKARDMAGTDENVVAIVGDAALTNGVSYEALNNISNTTKKFLVILNDNEWSIDKNVGSIATYLNRITMNPNYNRMLKDAEQFIGRIPKVGHQLVQLEHKALEAVKGMVVPSLIFEELGLRYMGPIDGHDIPLLVEYLEFAKKQNHPILLHVLTQKGKGYEVAIKNPEKFHGCSPFNIATGDSPKIAGAPPNYQDVFGDAMVKFCDVNSKLVGITGAMPSGTGLTKLKKAKPDRYFDVGIAEEHAVLFAAGMATMGYRPVCAIYSTFLQRSYDMIIHDVALQNLDVIFCMDRAGLSANDGPTHHGVFDISYARCVPNTMLMSPKDEDELVDMLWTALQHHGAIFIRYPRGAGEGVKIKEHPAVLPIGRAEVLQHGTEVAIFFYGPVQSIVKKTVEALKAQGITSVAIINARFAKPIDTETLEKYARICKCICTIEEHVLMGGFGSAVVEALQERHITTPVARVGYDDKFMEHASDNDTLRDKYGLNAKVAVGKIKECLTISAKPAAQFKVVGA